MKKIYYFAAIISAVLALLLSFAIVSQRKITFNVERIGRVDRILDSTDIYKQLIPGSTYHRDDSDNKCKATFWGPNQSKIVRDGNTIYMYVIDNSANDGEPATNDGTPSKFVVYKKASNSSEWERSSADIDVTAGGNLVVDSEGVLHAFVYTVNDIDFPYFGELVHYWFPKAPDGDIDSYQGENLISGSVDRYNTRIGAGININGNVLTCAYGFVGEGGQPNRMLGLWYSEDWGLNYTDSETGDDNMFYPYVLVDDNKFYLFTRLDRNGRGRKVLLYTFVAGGSWQYQEIASLDNVNGIVEQHDIFKDSSGNIHLFWREREDDDNEPFTSKHMNIDTGSVFEMSVNDEDGNTISVKWIRVAFEEDGNIYYICTSRDKLYVKKGDNGPLVEVYSFAGDDRINDIYPYVSAVRAGGSTSLRYVDVLILCGDKNEYPAYPEDLEVQMPANNYYVRIPKYLIKHKT